MQSRDRRGAAIANTKTKDCFNAGEAARRIDERTEEVLSYVKALESAPAPTEETLRKRISV
jgi:hypothetical protein